MKTEMSEALLDLRTELEEIATNGLEVCKRQERARAVRHNEWEGQSFDGRKHADAIGDDALPFEGAPDNRIPLVDTAIREKIALCKRAFFRGLVQAKAIEPDDAGRAANISALLGWLRDRVMREELDTEVELSAQYMFGDDPGLCVLEVCWLRDLSLVRRDLSFDELAEMFATGEQDPDSVPEGDERVEPEMLQEFVDLATNPKRDAEWLDWLETMFPGATRKALRAAARDLKRGGRAILPVPAIRENRPSIRALKLYDDVFFPLGTVDIQRSRSIHRREWLNKVELQERVHTLGWDSDWVDRVIAKGKGISVITSPGDWSGSYSGVSGLGGSALGAPANEHGNLFEVWWSYVREADDLGIPGIACTVWSGVVRDLPAIEAMADYPHGKYPFVLRTRERLSRQTTDSRGLSVPLQTHQHEMKVQRDARGAYVQLTASPPTKNKMRTGAFELVLGPNAQIPVQNMADFEVLVLPNFMQNSVEMEKVTRVEAEAYAGLMRLEADPNLISMIQQDEVDNFFSLWRNAFGQVLQLAQTFYTEEELDRVTGQRDMPLHLMPEDVRGGFDISIDIDARDLNMEFAMKKVEAFGKLLTYDTSGSLDRAKLTEWAAYAIDPVLAKRTITPQGEVTKQMIDQERNNVAGMALGVEPMMDPNGTTNPDFRLQTMAQTIQQSPKLAQMYGADPLFRQLADNYQKYLQQQIDQEQNKTIGKLGTKPQQGVPGLYAGTGAAVS